MTEGKILDMPQALEREPTTTARDASPVQKDVNNNGSTGTIPFPSRRENWPKRVSSIGWLSTSIVHDLRNPLGTVFAGAEMLMQLDPGSAQAKRLTVNIYHAASRMRELLADLAAVNCGRKSTPENCKLRDVINQASEAALPASETQSVQILQDVPDDLAMPLHRSRIQRVFFNLIANALEAMPHGGTIRIAARKADNCVLIAVEDTGPGIPDGIRERLFEPFVTAGKEHGLGLGLALSRQTVLDHGGDMWTEPASGARLVIRLPLTAEMTKSELSNYKNLLEAKQTDLTHLVRNRESIVIKTSPDALDEVQHSTEREMAIR
jgi:nitrogen-specific signal transduction histidine kinase